MPVPEFMRPVSDLSAIAGEMREWIRKREVSRWKRALERVGGLVAESPTDRNVVELRVRFMEMDAVLEWKKTGRRKFHADEIKSGPAFAGRFELKDCAADLGRRVDLDHVCAQHGMGARHGTRLQRSDHG